jgi:hypothetical protein
MAFAEKVVNGKIYYRKHILIIFIVLVIQLFIPYISTYYLLRFEKAKYQHSEYGQFYEKGHYIPLSTENAPKNYEFVIVRSDRNSIEEEYFTNDGQKIVLVYTNNKWKETTSGLIPLNLLQFILDSSSIIVFFVGLFHRMHRSGHDSMLRLMDYPIDNFEKLCLIYASSILVGGIMSAAFSSNLKKLFLN